MTHSVLDNMDSIFFSQISLPESVLHFMRFLSTHFKGTQRRRMLWGNQGLMGAPDQKGHEDHLDHLPPTPSILTCGSLSTDHPISLCIPTVMGNSLLKRAHS